MSRAVATGAPALERYLTLAQAVAWIAFQDTAYALRYEPDLTPGAYPVDTTEDAPATAQAPSGAVWLRVPQSVEGRRLWDAGARHDDQVWCATLALCRALTDGRLQASGDLLTAGRAAGEAITCRHEDPIVSAHLPCEIPLEWLHNRGGWLVISAATEADPKEDRYYCRVQIAADAVQRTWPAPLAGRDDLVRFMNERGADELKQTGRKPKASWLQQECRNDLKVTARAAKEAYRHVDPSVRRGRGEKVRP